LSLQRVGGVRLSLWRATALFRMAAAIFCCFVIVAVHERYRHPGTGLASAVVIVAVTAAVCWLAITGRNPGPWLVSCDVLVTVALTLLTVYVQTGAQRHQLDGGLITLTSVWAAGPVIEAGLVAGWLGGLAAASLQVAASIVVRGGWADGHTLTNAALLVMVGVVAGYVSRLAVRAEDELARATSLRAALAERERLSRSVHDGVLQVLGLVHRTAERAGGDWTELATAAAGEERALRLLLSAGHHLPGHAGEPVDLMGELIVLRSASVTVSGPGEPILLPGARAAELAAAVRAAVQNVAVHAGEGARAWVLVEDLHDAVAVTVRDDGVGMAPSRIADAAADARIGIARSIRGRLADLGGVLEIDSAPGRGTVLSMNVPKRAGDQ
jgi:signal transduction histidine kinase